MSKAFDKWMNKYEAEVLAQGFSSPRKRFSFYLEEGFNGGRRSVLAGLAKKRKPKATKLPKVRPQDQNWRVKVSPSLGSAVTGPMTKAMAKKWAKQWGGVLLPPTMSRGAQ